MKIIAVSPTPGTLEEFLGDSVRSSQPYTFPCLYKKIVNPREREKAGLPDTVDGSLYLSPLQLIPVFSTFRLHKNKTVVVFQEREQVIENIVLLELLFDSCISVQINLKDSLKGG